LMVYTWASIENLHT